MAAAVSLPGGKRRYLYGKTRQDVARKLTAATRDLQLGLPAVPERQSVKQFLEKWLQDSVLPTVKPRTYERYAELVELHIIPSLGQKPLIRLTPQDVQNLYASKLRSGLSPRTVQHIHAVLRRALGQALKWTAVSRNVATLVDAPRPQHKEVQPFSYDEALRLIEAVRGHHMEALYMLCVTVGLRQGEALGLRWRDLDLGSAVLHISVALQRIDGTYRLVEPKTPRSRRTIALPEIVVSYLRAHQGRQLLESLEAGSYWKDWGLVFTTPHGGPLDRHNVTRGFKLILKRAGLPNLRFHDLRHTCASFLLAQNVQPRDVMEILGHSQIGLTMNTYAHVMPFAQ